MSDIALTGLVGSHPLGALAAFGLLRCCEKVPATRGSRLSWKPAGGWTAVLHTPEPVADGELPSLLANCQTNARLTELTWGDNIKTTPAAFASAARSAAEQATPDQRDFADFLAAFACEMATGTTGELEPTAFYMTSGRQQFLKEVRTLAGRLSSGISLNRREKGAEEMFREALFGPWRYEDPQHSLGWDPSAERLHALRPKSPTKEAPCGVIAAVWLTFEALPLFPCFLSDGSLATRGFRGTTFSWPVWTEPASVAAVRSLLALEELTRESPPLGDLRQRGVAAVFRSERYKVKTQGNYFIFRPACPCTGPAGVG